MKRKQGAKTLYGSRRLAWALTACFLLLGLMLAWQPPAAQAAQPEETAIVVTLQMESTGIPPTPGETYGPYDYYTHQPISMRATVDMSGIAVGTTLNNVTLKLSIPKTYVEASTFVASGLESAIKSELKEDPAGFWTYSYLFPTLQGGQSVAVPFGMTTTRMVTPDGYILPVSATLYNEAGLPIKDPTIQNIKHHTLNPGVTKERVIGTRRVKTDNTDPGYGGSPNTANPALISTDGASYQVFSYSVYLPSNSLTNSYIGARYFGKQEIVDTLPLGAKFDPAVNPGWSLAPDSGDGVTTSLKVKYTWTAASPGEMNVLAGNDLPVPITLKVTFPDTPFLDYRTNQVSVTFSPYDMQSTEHTWPASDSIRFNMTPVLPAVNFDKSLASPGVLVDTMVNKTSDVLWNLTLNNTSADMVLENIIISDFDLDDKLDYTGFRLNTNAAHFEGTVDVFALGVNDVLLQQVADDIPASSSTFTATPVPAGTRKIRIVTTPGSGLKPGGIFRALIYTKMPEPVDKIHPDNNVREELFNSARMESATYRDTTHVFTDTVTRSIPFLPLEPKIYLAKNGSPSTLFIDSPNAYMEIIVKNPLMNPVHDEVFVGGQKIMDLLPVGIYYKPNSTVPTGTYTTSGTVNRDVLASLEPEIIYNYKNTGRTALIWTFKPDAVLKGSSYRYMPPTTVTADLFKIRFGVTAANYTAKGSHTNEAYFIYSNTTGPGAVPISQNAVADQWDLDNDGNTTELVAKASWPFTFSPPTELVVHKFVKGALDSSFLPTGGRTLVYYPGDYQIRAVNNGITDIQNLVIMDLLPFVGDTGLVLNDNNSYTERKSEFPVYLREAFTVPGHTVYYINQTNRKADGGFYTALEYAALPGWTTAFPQDYTQVKGFKVVANPGTILLKGSNLMFSLPLMTPRDPALRNGNIAYNSIAISHGDNSRFNEGSYASLTLEVYKVTGITFIDTNKDGTQNGLPLEPVVPGLRVRLTSYNALTDTWDTVINPLDNSEYITTTDAKGEYLFNVFRPGDYRIEILPPEGYTTTMSHEVTLPLPVSKDSHILTGGNVTPVFTLNTQTPWQVLNGGYYLVRDVTATKAWAVGSAPVPVTFQLYRASANEPLGKVPGAQPQTINPVTLENLLEPQSVSWPSQPGTDPLGGLYTYSIREEPALDGYQVAITNTNPSNPTSFTLTNTYNPVTVTATKRYDNGLYPDGPPDGYPEVVLELLRDGTVFGHHGMVNGVIDGTGTDNLNPPKPDGSGELAAWIYSWVNLPKTILLEDGSTHTYTYTVREANVPAQFQHEIDPLTGELVNIYRPGSITATKQWDGTPAASATLYLYRTVLGSSGAQGVLVDPANPKNPAPGNPDTAGVRVDGTVDSPLPADGSGERMPWRYTWVNLPANSSEMLGYNAGDPLVSYEYEIREDAVPPGYAVDTVTSASRYVSNVEQTVDITVTKRWLGVPLNENPPTVTFTLQRNGADHYIDGQLARVTLGPGDPLTHTWENLERYSLWTGSVRGNPDAVPPVAPSVEYVYSVVESPVSHYTASYQASVDGKTITYTNTRLANIGDYVWIDSNRDGLQDATDIPVEGVRVTLIPGEGVVLPDGYPTETWTDSQGNYLFPDLPPGTYTVVFDKDTLPAGYELTQANVGTDEALDSDGLNVLVFLGSQDNLDVDLGIKIIPDVPTIIKTIFHDGANLAHLDIAQQKEFDFHITVPVPNTVNTYTSFVITDTLDSRLEVVGARVINDTQGYFTVGIEGQTVTAEAFPADTYPPDPANFALLKAYGNIEMAITAKIRPNVLDTFVPNQAVFDYTNTYEAQPGSITSPPVTVSPILLKIGDYVWYDKDRDGIQDPGESPVPGVTVTLSPTGATALPADYPLTTQTDGAGWYEFPGLPPGTYTVTFSEATLPEGFGPTLSLAGTDRAVDSNGLTSNVTLVDRNDLTIDLGIVETPIPPAISKTINGSLSELTLPHGRDYTYNIRVALPNVIEEYTAFTITDTLDSRLVPLTAVIPDAALAPHFEVLCAGQTVTAAVRPAGFAALGRLEEPVMVELVITARLRPGVVDQDIPNRAFLTYENTFEISQLSLPSEEVYVSPVLYTIGDTVWYDDNQDGIQDPGEAGVPGVTVILTATGKTELPEGYPATAVTDGDGWYNFPGLPPGTYTVTFVESTLPEAYRPTRSFSGTDREKDSNGLVSKVNLVDHDDLSIDLGIITNPVTPGGEAIRVELAAQKSLTGRSLKAGEFTFELRDYPGNVLERASNQEDGAVRFTPRRFSSAGTYLYTIREIPGTQAGMRYDSTVYTLRVVVSSSGSALSAAVEVLKDGVPYAGGVIFKNHLNPPSTGDPILGSLLLLALGAAGLGGTAFMLKKRKYH